MNKNDKDFLNQLSNLDDFSVEEIAENYPALYGNTKKRILKKCLKKDVFSAEIETDDKEAITISGTERYKRRPLYRFAASAAAFVLAVGGITSVFMLNRNLNGNDIAETEKTSVVSINDSWTDSKTTQATVASSGKDNVDDSFVYWGTNDDTTSQTPSTVIEPTGYSGEEVETQKSYLEGRYFIVIDNGKCNGFEFSLDGTIKTFTFDVPHGNFKRYTGEIFGYELIENRFSYGTIGDEANWKTGTIINPNDGTKFSVQFDDSVYTFSKDNSILEYLGEKAEPQKSFLNGLYYVEIVGVSGYCDENQITRGVHGYMGFEFMPDGTLTKYFFDETGNAIGSTIVMTNYEIVENQFSFGDKAGTIVNSNDSTSFTVQFDDGDIFNFSTKQPTFRKYYFIGTKPDTLNGTIWAKCFGDMDENYNYTDRRTIEFNEDGISGTVYILSHPRDVTKSTITEIPFTYEQNGDEITFYMESSAYAMVKAEIACNPYDKEYGLDVEYLEADKWGTTLWCFGQVGCLNDYHYNY